MRLSDVKTIVQDVERTVTDANGNTFSIWYNPENITGELYSKMKKAHDSNNITLDFAIDVIISIISKWDLLEDDDTVIALTQERLLKMRLGVLALIIRHLMTDQEVKKKKVKS